MLSYLVQGDMDADERPNQKDNLSLTKITQETSTAKKIKLDKSMTFPNEMTKKDKKHKNQQQPREK